MQYLYMLASLMATLVQAVASLISVSTVENLKMSLLIETLDL